MVERRTAPRSRTLRGGKIVFNSGRSAIDCTVRNISQTGACVEIQSPFGIPLTFFLMISGDGGLRDCSVAWRSGNRLGVCFGTAQVKSSSLAGPEIGDQIRAERSAFRAALDQVEFGVVLLDHELRAQYINRTYRRIFRVSDVQADSRPPFVALMYHGRDTRAYELPDADLDRYVADRVAKVKDGDPTPIDIRLSDGGVVRFQCAVLPGGGRMLSYTFVTDIVRRSDELKVLQAALDGVDEGIILLDAEMNAKFMNRAVRELWRVPDAKADRHPNITELVEDALTSGAYGVAPDRLPDFVARRIARIRNGDPTPSDLTTGDGRIIRSQCTSLPSGGRMLTYCDVTDIVRSSERMEAFATIDATTGLFNRRHFLSLAEAEWSRFQRYQRPLALLVVDVDYFKSINDRFGHDAGDEALRALAKALQSERRSSDIIGRFGGDEFLLLLPETDKQQAAIVAGRLCASVRELKLGTDANQSNLSISVGLATARLAMRDITALVKAGDQALYEAKEKRRDRYAVAEERYVPELAAE